MAKHRLDAALTAADFLALEAVDSDSRLGLLEHQILHLRGDLEIAVRILLGALIGITRTTTRCPAD